MRARKIVVIENNQEIEAADNRQYTHAGSMSERAILGRLPFIQLSKVGSPYRPKPALNINRRLARSLRYSTFDDLLHFQLKQDSLGSTRSQTGRRR